MPDIRRKESDLSVPIRDRMIEAIARPDDLEAEILADRIMAIVDDLAVTGRTPTSEGVRTDSRPHWRGRTLPRPVQRVWFPRLRGRLADLIAPWHVDAYMRAINRRR